MTPQPLLCWALAVVTAGALSLAGCGGGSASTSSAPAAGRQGDAAIARTALVRLSDFPAGWTSRPDDANDFRCAATKAVEAHPHAKSDRFEPTTGAGATQHEVAVLASEDAADAALDALVAQATLACYARQGEDSVRKQLPAGTTLGDVTTARLNATPSGDRTVGIRLTYPVSANGVDVTVYEDFSFSRVGRGLSLFAFVSQGTVPDDTLDSDLARRGAQRLRTALGGG